MQMMFTDNNSLNCFLTAFDDALTEFQRLK